ncbi:hypothetical protein BU26DRAFT_436240 [Trematosphaeria pertusa]|uniref:CHRD domain-containing protein n=1 Tax=Trematosphaeria pertusa TaxID=390896 RepID=A0A6A6I0X2_9PLEO|nr:uncharacterized protein BU26DRAFT_436240 [Trematosphaeria pertusa]KAF2243799.1 hypothetical protein BU26DRAFT_436240 [Trematosphaeria pertusa]
MGAVLGVASLALGSGAVPLDLNNLNNGHLSLQLNIDLNQDAFGANAFAANDLFTFTSLHSIQATPDQVVNDTTPTGGLAGASGVFNFGINSHANMICYNITLHNFQGEFESPADTATHIHEAARGASGPPRIAFPNPEPIDEAGTVRNSAGCLKGPFVTGVIMEEKDTGEGFHVSQIEQNPAAFMADTHSSLALPGAVRGQIA